MFEIGKYPYGLKIRNQYPFLQYPLLSAINFISNWLLTSRSPIFLRFSGSNVGLLDFAKYQIYSFIIFLSLPGQLGCAQLIRSDKKANSITALVIKLRRDKKGLAKMTSHCFASITSYIGARE
jgi:hypothetical protein